MQGWEQVAREADFNPSKMASLCSISERQLQRIFKRHLNCTPSRWLRELQCRLARDLIQSGYTSRAAAAELKFASEAHFCREFKKVFGNPPQSFAPNSINGLHAADLEKDLKGAARAAKSNTGTAGAQPKRAWSL
jgi:AraC-like DNA-binding protein